MAAGGDISRTAIELMRKNVEERKKAVSVLVQENQINSSARLAQSIAEIDGVLLDTEVIQVVVNDDLSDIEDVYPIPPSELAWELERRDGKQRWYPISA